MPSFTAHTHNTMNNRNKTEEQKYKTEKYLEEKKQDKHTRDLVSVQQ